MGWNRLDNWLDTAGKKDKRFTNTEYAAAVGLDWEEASYDIGAFQHAQRRPIVQTRTLKNGEARHHRPKRPEHAIHRVPGTRGPASVWKVGPRVTDMSSQVTSFVDDTQLRLRDAVAPTLRHMGTLNPIAARASEAMISSHLAALEKGLEALVQGAIQTRALSSVSSSTP